MLSYLMVLVSPSYIFFLVMSLKTENKNNKTTYFSLFLSLFAFYYLTPNNHYFCSTCTFPFYEIKFVFLYENPFTFQFYSCYISRSRFCHILKSVLTELTINIQQHFPFLYLILQEKILLTQLTIYDEGECNYYFATFYI